MVEAAQAQASANGAQIGAITEYVMALETRVSNDIAELHNLGLAALDAQAAETDAAIADLAQHQQQQLNALEADLTGVIADLLRMGEDAFSEQQSQIDAITSHIVR